MSNLKRNDINELTYKAQRDSETHRFREQTYGCMGKEWEEKILREFGVGIYTLLYLKWIANKDLLYSTRNSAQCYVAVWMGRGFEG